MDGFIKLYRELINKSIFKQSTPEQVKILIALLLIANHKEAEWEWKEKKYYVKPGEMITSLNSIVKKCGKGITIRNIRTALKRFKKFGFLTYESTNEGTRITITNWELYQSDKSKRQRYKQTTDKGLTTNKNNKNNKNKIYSGVIQDNFIREIVDYLNLKVHTHYRYNTKSTQKYIFARYKEGYTLKDFKNVIDKKTEEWIGTDMEKYLRPDTLFGSKFELYLNQPQNKQEIKSNANAYRDNIEEEETIFSFDENGNLIRREDE